MDIKETYMPTFTRKVIKVEAEDVNDLTSVVKVAHWRVTCDQDQSISAYGTQPLSEPNPDDFMDLSIITETTVISWLGSDFWEEIEQRLSSQFLTKQTSTKVDKVFAGTAADGTRTSGRRA